MELVGINEATTFPGLCNKHDSELFRPIEVGEITLTNEQLFLFSYRALLREQFTKLQAQKHHAFMKAYVEKHADLQHPEFLSYLHFAALGTDHGMEALLHHKKIYDQVFRTRRYADMRGVALYYDRSTPLLCATAFSPEYTYDCRLLQNLADLNFIQNFISFSIWSLNSKGLAIFAWHSSPDKSCIPFIDSLLAQPKRRLGPRLASLAFEHSEDVVFSPIWWAAISRRNQEIFRKRMIGGTSMGDRQSDYLKDDTNTAISAEIIRISRFNF